ncbi:MAG TPA: UDP-2,3-diacylglucosamine diphosphatase [Woeseiaceae bacterium]|nr:UDP-2,3-diacylglucosamine diphosphatase [Woeseiaceae bacterium]
MPSSYRTIWISDVHLGTSACRAEDLLNFLSEVSAHRIYLVGDVIDLERMKTRAIFPDSHRKVLARLMQLSQAGTEILYIPGNHDFQFRELAGNEFHGVPVMLEAEHRTRDGRRLLVTHGDLLDHQVRTGTGLEKFGATAYRMLVNLDVTVNQMRSRLGQDYLPISAGIKQRLNSANEYIRRFEEAAARHAAQRGFDGIVCGHIHRPCLRTIDGVHYANDGDWIEHRTALTESHDGQLQILQWTPRGSTVQADPRTSPLAA